MPALYAKSTKGSDEWLVTSDEESKAKAETKALAARRALSIRLGIARGKRESSVSENVDFERNAFLWRLEMSPGVCFV